MARFFIKGDSFVIANATIEPFFGRIEQKHALSGSYYQRHPVDNNNFIFLGQPLFMSKSLLKSPTRRIVIIEEGSLANQLAV